MNGKKSTDACTHLLLFHKLADIDQFLIRDLPSKLRCFLLRLIEKLTLFLGMAFISDVGKSRMTIIFVAKSNSVVMRMDPVWFILNLLF